MNGVIAVERIRAGFTGSSSTGPPTGMSSKHGCCPTNTPTPGHGAVSKPVYPIMTTTTTWNSKGSMMLPKPHGHTQPRTNHEPDI